MNFQQAYNALFDKTGRVKNYEKAFSLLLFAAKMGIPMPKILLDMPSI